MKPLFLTLCLLAALPACAADTAANTARLERIKKEITAAVANLSENDNEVYRMEKIHYWQAQKLPAEEFKLVEDVINKTCEARYDALRAGASADKDQKFFEFTWEPEKVALGDYKHAAIGQWQIRLGVLTDSGAAALGNKDLARKAFATATLTAKDAAGVQWTLGIRRTASVLEGKKDPTVWYLQAPDKWNPGPQAQIQSCYNSRKPIKTLTLTANPDKTYRLAPLTTSGIVWNLKAGESTLAFDLKDAPATLALIENLGEPPPSAKQEKEKEKPAAPKPPSR